MIKKFLINYFDSHKSLQQDLEKKNAHLDKKIPDVSGLVTTTVLNTKICEFENKIPNVGWFSKKKRTGYDATISDIEGKYFTTSDYNKLTSDILDV